jgi:alpha-glucoside transport system substrate-binding protein
MAAETESLIWYPRLAFERAGYAVPRTWQELLALTARMRADGRAPWCLGLGDATDAVDLIEERVLRTGGLYPYDAWAAGAVTFSNLYVRSAFSDLGDVALTSGNLPGGLASALRTPVRIAAWPMFTDPPGCWLHLGDGTERLAWPAGGNGILSSFPVPVDDPRLAQPVRGRLWSVVVFHDRPEVRRVVSFVLGDGLASAGSATLAADGIWLVRSLGGAATAGGADGPDGELLRSALRAGELRASASDLMPAPVAEAFGRGALDFLQWGPASLTEFLDQVQSSWTGVK